MQGLTLVENYAIVFLAAVIGATLQLGLGCLLLLYHASLGKHLAKRTKKLVSSFTFGFAAMVALLLSTTIFIFTNTVKTMKPEITGVIVGVLVALAILAWFFYYRRSDRKTTEIWIPKPVSKILSSRAEKTESTVEAFSLGLLACLTELPFTLVLFVVAAGAITNFSAFEQLLAVLLYTFINLLPLIIFRLAVRKSKTVVEVQKWRVKNRNFLRFITGIGYITLGLFLWAFKVMGGSF